MNSKALRRTISSTIFVKYALSERRFRNSVEDECYTEWSTRPSCRSRNKLSTSRLIVSVGRRDRRMCKDVVAIT